MSLNPKEFSIVEWCGLSAHKCGYCSETSKKADSSISHGMVAHTMNVNTYQELIDRGWRRSGTYCYKPVMDKTCCAQYTIRNNALHFKISKSQKKVIKKFNKFLSDGEQTSKSNSESNSVNETMGGDEHNKLNVNTTDRNIDFDMEKCIEPLCDEESGKDLHLGKELLRQSKPSPPHCNEERKASTSDNSSRKVSSRKCAGADPNKPTCKKAKLLRLERKQQKMMIAHGQVVKQPTTTSNEPKSLDELIDEVKENDAKHRLQIKTICSNSLNKRQLDEEFEVYFKYQTIIHNDPPKKCNLTDFKRFLVNTPLQDEECEDSLISYGSFHQQYWLNDKLIAVGVIDILPRCISSVYLFYDPAFRDLTLGTYAALREIAFTRKMYEISKTIEYYYMGFYIHSCPKMRYKGNFHPSELACPETYRWIDISRCAPKLDYSNSYSYSRLDEDDEAVDINDCNSDDVKQMKILLPSHKFVSAKHYQHFNRNKNLFLLICKLIGLPAIQKILLYDS